MKCITCVHINPDQRPTMTGMGFSSCKFGAVGVYKSLVWDRKCDRYAKAAGEIIEARQIQQNTTGSS